VKPPKIISIGFAVPPKSYTQREVFTALGYPHQFWSLFAGAQIDKRHMWMPMNTPLTWQQATDEYQRGAESLTCDVVKQCMDTYPMELVRSATFASCTGYSCPSVVHHVSRELKLQDNVFITPILGTGCFPRGYDVFTDLGFKDISEIENGNSVMTDDGAFSPASDKSARQYSGILKVIKSRGLPPLKVTPEHPFKIVRPKISKRGEVSRPDSSWFHGVKNWDWSPKCLRADELQYGDYLMVTKPRFQPLTSLKVTDLIPSREEGEFAIPLRCKTRRRKEGKIRLPCESSEINKIRNELLTPRFLRFCGLYVAEGSPGKDGTIELSFGDEPDLILETMEILRYLGLKPTTTPNPGSLGSLKSKRVRAWSKALSRLLIDWFGEGAENKTLPAWIYRIKKGLKESFISGMWAGDGKETDRGKSYSTASKKLAEGLCLLMATVGKSFSWHTEWNNGFRQDWQQIVLEKRINWYDDGEHLWIPIEVVADEQYSGTVYNFTMVGHFYNCGLATVHNCEGAFPALKRAYDFTAATGGWSLAISCEICSVCHFPEDGAHPDETREFELLRANAIFGDGASAVLVGYDDNPRHPYLLDFETYFDPENMKYLGFLWQDGRLRCLLSRQVPKVVPGLVENVLERILFRNHIIKNEIKWWVIHPGGRAVLDNIRDKLGLSEEHLTLSRDILRQYGNCSSATLGFVGKRLMQEKIKPGDTGVILSLGAGLAAGATLFRFPEVS